MEPKRRQGTPKKNPRGAQGSPKGSQVAKGSQRSPGEPKRYPGGAQEAPREDLKKPTWTHKEFKGARPPVHGKWHGGGNAEGEWIYIYIYIYIHIYWLVSFTPGSAAHSFKILALRGPRPRTGGRRPAGGRRLAPAGTGPMPKPKQEETRENVRLKSLL